MGNSDSKGNELWEPRTQNQMEQIWEEEQRGQNIENVDSVKPEHILDTSVKDCEELMQINFVWNHGGNDVRMVSSADAWMMETKLHRNVNTSGGIEYNAVIDLPPGLHWYKFVVDGVWACARDQPYKRELEGGYVNYVCVRSYSTQSLVSAKQRVTKQEQEEWGSNFKFEHLGGTLPQAPPHLGAILLNVKPSDIRANEWDKKPSHCVYNHLYLEQTTTDDIMVLGMTERYRDKAYTTVMYRPKTPKTPSTSVDFSQY